MDRDEAGEITLKLADFGLAMEVVKPIYMVCGTPTYVAPEILTHTGPRVCINDSSMVLPVQNFDLSSTYF